MPADDKIDGIEAVTTLDEFVKAVRADALARDEVPEALQDPWGEIYDPYIAMEWALTLLNDGQKLSLITELFNDHRDTKVDGIDGSTAARVFDELLREFVAGRLSGDQEVNAAVQTRFDVALGRT